MCDAFQFSLGEGLSPRPVFTEPPSDLVVAHKAHKLFCTLCKTALTARLDVLNKHTSAPDHIRAFNALSRVTQDLNSRRQSQLGEFFVPRGAAADEDPRAAAMVALTQHLLSEGFPLYAVDRLLSPYCLRLLSQLPAALPSGQQFRRAYVAPAVTNVVSCVRRFVCQWRGFVVLLEDESTERRAAHKACVVVRASTPEGLCLLSVQLLEGSLNGAALAALFDDAVLDCTLDDGAFLSWSDVIGVAGDNVSYNDTAFNVLLSKNPNLVRLRCGSHTIALPLKGFISKFNELLVVLSAVRKYAAG